MFFKIADFIIELKNLYEVDRFLPCYISENADADYVFETSFNDVQNEIEVDLTQYKISCSSS